MTELDFARLEPPLPLVDQHSLPAAAIHNGAFRNGQNGFRTAGVDLGIDIHVVKQQQFRIGQFDAHARRARLLVDLRVDDVDLPREFAPGKAPRAHQCALADDDATEVTFGNVHDSPHHRMIGNPEQGLAGLCAHAFDDIAFENDPVARRGPFDSDRNVPAFLHGDDGRIRHVEVHQPLARASSVGPVPAGNLGIERRDVFGGGGRHRRTVDFHQGLPLDDVRSRGDVGNFLDVAFGAHRDHGDAPFVELNGAGGADHCPDHAPRGRLRFDAGALDLSRRDLDRSVVAVVALVDGDVIHPHRVLLGLRRNIRQAHGIAVIFDLAIGRRRRDGRRRCF